MHKPAIFIDSYISNDENKKWLDYNLCKYVKNNWDVFIISNKMPSFDHFSKIKYFEFDSRNRILNDRSKYKLNCSTQFFYILYENNVNYRVDGSDNIHGFTNWSILYNIKKMCKTLKSFGYTHAIRCEYDVTFKDYDLMNTIFKSFGKTEKSKNCMIIPDIWGCTTNFFLFDVNYIDSKIPDLETEDDYNKFVYKLYGDNISPIFETLFNDLIKNDCEYLNKDHTYTFIENINNCMSDDQGFYRHKIMYNKLFMTPINDNSEFFMFNESKIKSIYVNFSTYNKSNELKSNVIFIEPGSWRKFECNKSVIIKTSDMNMSTSVTFDLNEPCKFTMVKI